MLTPYKKDFGYPIRSHIVAKANLCLDRITYTQIVSIIGIPETSDLVDTDTVVRQQLKIMYPSPFAMTKN